MIVESLKRFCAEPSRRQSSHAISPAPNTIRETILIRGWNWLFGPRLERRGEARDLIGSFWNLDLRPLKVVSDGLESSAQVC